MIPDTVDNYVAAPPSGLLLSAADLNAVSWLSSQLMAVSARGLLTRIQSGVKNI
jgi:hypothetical protein